MRLVTASVSAAAGSPSDVGAVLPVTLQVRVIIVAAASCHDLPVILPGADRRVLSNRAASESETGTGLVDLESFTVQLEGKLQVNSVQVVPVQVVVTSPYTGPVYYSL